MLEAVSPETQKSECTPAEPVPGDRGIDRITAETAAAALLTALGFPEGSETAARTPARMVAGLTELLTASPFEFTTFPNRTHHHELVIVRDVAFTSVCAHHVLPFFGTAQIGVLPDARLAGLSKLARAVERFAAGFQIQEELGQQVAGFLEDALDCRGVAVLLSAEHLCMTRRGVRAHAAETITLASRGEMHTDPVARSEFLQLVRPGVRRAA